MSYMLDDRLALFEYFEREGLLAANTDSQMAGPRMYGYVSDLPAPNGAEPVQLQALVGLGRIAGGRQHLAGHVRRVRVAVPGQTERAIRAGLLWLLRTRGRSPAVDHRGDSEPAVRLRLRLVATWRRRAELLGRKYVYSRKPVPAHISGPQPHWELLEKDMRDTYAAARDCHLEILYRDIYTIEGERSRLRRWVDMTKSIFQI